MGVMWFNCVMLQYDIVGGGEGREGGWMWCVMLQYDIVGGRGGEGRGVDVVCTAAVDTNDLELIDEISLKGTENVLSSDVTYKQKLSVSCWVFCPQV